jgi:hypothetical protein
MVIKHTTMTNGVADMSLDEAGGSGDIECGKEAAKEFNFAEGFRNMNHGIFVCCGATAWLRGHSN